MTISKKEMERLDAASRRRFHLDLTVWLRRHAPRATLTDDATLLGLIERQEEHAAHYGLCTKREITKWCYLALITREDFDDFDGVSPIAELLHDPAWGRRPGERLDNLLRQLAQTLDRLDTEKGTFK